MSAVNIISFAFGLAAGFALLWVVARLVLTERRVDHTDWIVVANPIFKAFREQCALLPVRSLNKALHPIPPQTAQES